MSTQLPLLSHQQKLRRSSQKRTDSVSYDAALTKCTPIAKLKIEAVITKRERPREKKAVSGAQYLPMIYLSRFVATYLLGRLGPRPSKPMDFNHIPAFRKKVYGKTQKNSAKVIFFGVHKIAKRRRSFKGRQYSIAKFPF
jgi:hypothetical protein